MGPHWAQLHPPHSPAWRGIQPHTLSYLERQGGRRGQGALAGLNGRVASVEPRPPGLRHGTCVLPAVLWEHVAGDTTSQQHSPVITVRVSLDGLWHQAAQGIPRQRVGTPQALGGSKERPELAARAITHDGSWARQPAWQGREPCRFPAGRGQGRPAHATPPHIHTPGVVLPLRVLRSGATASSWLRPTAALQQAQRTGSQVLCVPEVRACQEASPGMWEDAFLPQAPWGCCPGWGSWRQGGESSGWGGLQLDEGEGSFICCCWAVQPFPPGR